MWEAGRQGGGSLHLRPDTPCTCTVPARTDRMCARRKSTCRRRVAEVSAEQVPGRAPPGGAGQEKLHAGKAWKLGKGQRGSGCEFSAEFLSFVSRCFPVGKSQS